MVNKDLIKRLSHSSERPIRDQAFDELEQLINNNEINFEHFELMGLFEGIFWWFWFADKPAYQESLAKRIVKFTTAIKSEEDKQTWVRYFFKWLWIHWNSIDYHSVNEYLSLVRNQLVALFGHFEVLWASSNRKAVQVYMNILYVESLYESEVPLGLGMHVADIYIEEISKAFDKNTLSQKKMVQLLSPFINALGQTKQLALYERIKEKVFLKLIESNGVGADESGPLYFPKFDIVEYAEVDIFTVASDANTIESRRSDIYDIYDKASGKEKTKEEPLSYAERLQLMQAKPIFKPQTKHQKKVVNRDKAKQASKIKKRILKMIRKQALQTFPGFVAEDSKISMEGEEDTKPLNAITNGLLSSLNKKVKAQEAVVGVIQENGDKVVEIASQEKKKKSKKIKVLSSINAASKKVIFELGKNKTKEFYMHGKVGVEDIPKSKDVLLNKPSIIKKNLVKRKKH